MIGGLLRGMMLLVRRGLRCRDWFVVYFGSFLALWSVNIAMVQDVNNAMVLTSWEAFSLARPGCSVAEYLIWSGRNSL